MKFNHAEDLIQLTPMWTGERFADGRPRVSDALLARLRRITLEEAWAGVKDFDFHNQFEGRFHRTHPGRKMVGRAVTAVLVPKRPDLDTTLMNQGLQAEGRRGFFNQWVIDTLVEDDVVVVDLFDKVHEGTYVGGNLSTAIATRTKRGGAVIWGGIRDLEQIEKIPDVQIYYRGTDPTPIMNVTMVGFNTPARIGNAICMPGDVVIGTQSGVYFIPPHIAEYVAEDAEKNHVRDIFGFLRLEEKAYTTAQIDAPWTVPMWEDFLRWFGTDARAEDYRHLAWEKELQDARSLAAKAGAPQ